jgi:hypothetical protein
MSQDFTTTLSVDQTPEEAFAAITNEVFTYRYQDVHYSKQRIIEFTPGKKVVWRVLDASLNFTDDPSKWTGTELTFEVAR